MPQVKKGEGLNSLPPCFYPPAVIVPMLEYRWFEGENNVTRSRIIVSDHARWQASRRGLDEALVLRVAQSPEQVIPVRPGREIRQAVVTQPPHKTKYLVRVIVDVLPDAVEIVTVYRTSKIKKYWRPQ